MSAPTEPYANGFGIILGILILWGATLVLFLAGKHFLFPAAGG
jgi:hypothetical protein